jgi:hypothetical protein
MYNSHMTTGNLYIEGLACTIKASGASVILLLFLGAFCVVYIEIIVQKPSKVELL